jgi:hypothetical protein
MSLLPPSFAALGEIRVVAGLDEPFEGLGTQWSARHGPHIGSWPPYLVAHDLPVVSVDHLAD